MLRSGLPVLLFKWVISTTQNVCLISSSIIASIDWKVSATFNCSGDQDSKIPLTQTRMIANVLAKELKLVPFGNYAPWYDKKQVYIYIYFLQEKKNHVFCDQFFSLCLFIVIENLRSVWWVDSVIWPSMQREKRDIFDICYSQRCSAWGSIHFAFTSTYTLPCIS